MRAIFAATALLLAGCSGAQPWLPLTSFTMEGFGEAPGLLSQPETPSGPVAGYGLKTLGSTELIVKFAADSDNPRPSRGVFVEKLPTGADLYQLASEEELQTELEELWEREDCLLAEPNASFETLALPSEYNAATHGHLDKIGAPAAWGLPQGIGSSSVVVAVVDTGLAVTSGIAAHTDLRSNLMPSTDWINVDKFTSGVVSQRTDVNDGTNTGSGAGHGTRVAGVIAAVANNGGALGVAPGCKLLPVRANTNNGNGLSYTTASVANGILYAIAKPGVKVINLSMGTSVDSPTLLEAVDQATASDVLVVAAAGNNGLNQPMYPAAYDAVLSVAGTSATDRRSTFSNFGTWVKMAAPAENIYTTLRDSLPGSYGTSSAAGANSGTSYAAAMVSGAAALVRSAQPTWRAASVLKVLQTTGAPTTGFATGRPLRLDVSKALAVLTPPPALAAAVRTSEAFPGSTQARIKGNLTAPGWSSVTYGLDKALSGATTTVQQQGTRPTSRPTFELSGLTPAVTYFYRINVRDPHSGQVLKGKIQKLLTGAPKIKKLTAKSATHTGNITWTTTAPVTAKVTWGVAADALSSTALDVPTFGTSYEASLTGLLPGSTYYYKIEGVSQDGVPMVPKTGTIKTGKLAVTASVLGATSTSMVLKVVAKTPHRVSAAYDPDPTVAAQLAASGTFVTGLQSLAGAASTIALEQPVTISGLTSGTTYTIIVKAEDTFGNVTVLKPIIGRTLARSTVEFGIAALTPTGITLDVHTNTPPGTGGLSLFIASKDEYDKFVVSTSTDLNSAFRISGTAVGTTTTTNYRLVSGTLVTGQSYCGRLRIGTAAPFVWTPPFFFTTP
jgi:thermitase